MNMESLDLSTTLHDSAKLVACARSLLAHIEQSPTLNYREQLDHITGYMIGELEKCAAAAQRLQTLRLASGTRNLFELSFVVDYVCTKDKNMDRFIIDAAIDELEIMEKFRAVDQGDGSSQPNQNVLQRETRLREKIASAKLTDRPPLQAFDIAKAVNREGEYREWYKVYSKMTHATGWAIFGACSWENMALLLLVKANGYTAECIRCIAVKSGLRPQS